MKNIFKEFKSLTDNQKTAVVSIPLLIIIFFLVKPFIGTQRSKVSLMSTTGEISYPKAISIQAQKGIVAKSRYAIFKFTDDEVAQIESCAKLTNTLSMSFFLEEKGDYTQNEIKLSYLYESDFDEKGNYANFMTERVEVYGNLSEVTANHMAVISFALEKDETKGGVKVPRGFVFSAENKTRLINVIMLPAEVGYSDSGIPCYSYSSNGGKITPFKGAFDFSGSEFVFPTYETASSNMPVLKISLKNNGSTTNDFEQQKIEFVLGGETITLKTSPGNPVISIPVLPLKNPFSNLEIKSGVEYISSVFLQPQTPNYKSKSNGQVLIPYPADPGLILSWPVTKWRTSDYELFSWDRFPEYLIFDFKNYAVQSKFLGRLAYFVEKQGYKGRLLTNEELSGKHDYNAHDYSAESLARFFSKAKKEHFLLNNEEELLKDILLYNNIIVEDGNEFKAGSGCILSISQESNGWLRDRLFAHEGWHMFYFADEEFRNYITACYFTCDSSSLNFLIDYFKSQDSLGYDTNDDYLMQNEFMAYLMQQPQNQVGEYFVSLANRGSVMKYTKDLAKYVRDTNGEGFEDAARMINDYVFDRWGITGGNICLIRR